jgi:predicted ATPase
VREMLSEYFEVSRRIVHSYGGEVEKFIGDAVMAVWGAPVAHEDDAERAVRAALDMVSAVAGLGDRLGHELRVRVGVLTGEAAVELDRVAQGMVIGDAINTASRIQSVAEPGAVLVDDVTRTVTGGAIAYEDAGVHVVKGKAEPVHTWRALRVVGAVGGTWRSGMELPLVGREHEMGLLRHALDDVIGARTGLRLVSIVGEPGLGKSRLGWELAKYADGLAATVLWHHGQALSFGQGVGFSALAEMVRMRAEITVEEPADSQRLKLERLMDDVFGSPRNGNGDGVLRALTRLLGLDDGTEPIDRGELLSSWRLLFQRLAERAPVLMRFEDLHWADQGLFDFIVHLCEWAADSPILVLVFSRPDDRLDALEPLGTRIDLTPLSDSEIETLVATAVEGAPGGLMRNVRRHAAGVPLFAVESLRMLADRGVMVAEGEAQRYRLIAEIEDLDVPPSIHALVAARLDRLGEFERAVLRAGAVLDQRFTAAAAAAIAGIGSVDARSLLDGLLTKQFLAVDSDPRSQSRGTYSFVHIQVQRVVLGTLSKRERKARHLAAVQYLSAQEPDPSLAAILAGHLLAAFQAYPNAPDAPELRTRALRLTLEAAQRAEAVGALNEAIALYDQAAQIEVDDSRHIEHLVQAARCAERYGNQEEIAARRYAAAGELHERAGRTREMLRLRARELYTYRGSRPPGELIVPLREVYDALRGTQDAEFADTAVALASMLYSGGEADEAERVAAEAVLAAERAGARPELAMAVNLRACALIELARPVDALPLFQEARAMAERFAPSDLPASLGNIAVTFTALGRFEQAVAAGREAIAAADRLASRADRTIASLNLARALFSLGQWDEAAAMVEGAAPDTAPFSRGMLIGPPLLASLYRGEPDRARAVIEEFDRFQAESGAAFESDYRSLREVALAHISGAGRQAQAVIENAQSGDYAEWPTWLPLAVDLVSRLPGDAPLREVAAALDRDLVPRTSPIVVAQVARIRALRACRDGATDEAVTAWLVAIDAVERAGVAFDSAALRLELFEHAPRDAAAVGDLQAVIETFSRVRATPWLERAQRAVENGHAGTAPAPLSFAAARSSKA